MTKKVKNKDVNVEVENPDLNDIKTWKVICYW